MRAYVTSKLAEMTAATAAAPSVGRVSMTEVFAAAAAPAGGADDDNAHVVGPDTVPVYDPATDDQGYFVSHQTLNNCYNYANDIVTDTFAQPGRGGGHKWTSDTCSNINASAQVDGLTWVGTKLPTAPPAKGHHVGMWIWPNTNFHWCRHDTNKLWSHKPGQTPVMDVDNNGNPITNPAKVLRARAEPAPRAPHFDGCWHARTGGRGPVDAVLRVFHHDTVRGGHQLSRPRRGG